jgi:hypothetical protein
MATYVNNLRLKEITTGDEDGTWGTSTNTNLELIGEAFSYGVQDMAADANETFTMLDATADDVRSFYLKITSAVSLTTTREVTLGPNTVSKVWMIENATSGSQIITIKQGSGATVNVPNGSKVMVVTDGAGAGAAVFNANPTEVGGTVTSVGGTGTVQGLTLSGTVTSSGNLTLGGSLADVDLTSQVTGTLPIANGGTGSTTASGALTNFGITATATELNYTDGVTSNIQAQLDAKVGTVTSVGGTGTVDGLTLSGTVTSSGDLTLSGSVSIDNSNWSGADLSLANGGTGASLVDPNADRIFFWDDSAGATTFLTVGSGLQISGTTLENTQSGGSVTSVAGTGNVNGLTLSGTVTTSGSLTLGGTLAINNSDWSGTDLSLANGGTGASLTDPNADRIFFWDDSAGATTFLTVGSGLQISGTTLENTQSGGTVTSVAVSGGTTGLTTSGGPITGSGTITLAGTLAVANGGTGVTTSTGTGSVVLSSSPTLTTPNLGTPSAATLTNATGLPISTGVSGLGTGVATFLGTPSSANLRAALTDETGTGSAVFATSPTLVTPVLGTPTSGTLTNCTVDGTYAIGYRNIPPVGSKTTSYTLATGDVGKYVEIGSGGSITIPDSTFSNGDVVSVFNNTSSSVTITCSITTAYIAGTDTDVASVTLTTRGVATVMFISGTICTITGNVS